MTISSIVAPSLPYAMFSLMLAVKRAGSCSKQTFQLEKISVSVSNPLTTEGGASDGSAQEYKDKAKTRCVPYTDRLTCHEENSGPGFRK